MKIEVIAARSVGPMPSAPVDSGRPVVGVVAATAPSRDVLLGQSPERALARSALEAALRQQIPKQGSPMPLLANLAWLATDAAGAEAALPEPVRAAAAALWESMPDVDDIGDASALERACRASGVRLENLLAGAAPEDLARQLPGDWKALLFRLKGALARSAARGQPAGPSDDTAHLPGRRTSLVPLAAEPATLPGADSESTMLDELAVQTGDSIARVACNQLASLEAGERGAPGLMLEMPLRREAETSLLRLRFERSAPRDGVGPVTWSVEFAIDLGAAGPLRGSVALTKRSVEVTLHARNAALVDELVEAREELQRGLGAAGLSVASILCLRDRAPHMELPAAWLVDMRA